jgi:para-nitrobenzyl esterase
MNKSTKMNKTWISAALVAIALICARHAAAQIGIVTVTGGHLEGVTVDGITSFKGIPFAAPPVGKLRWRAAQPVIPWHGIRRADRFAPSCMQSPGMLKAFAAPPALSEDCLYLNVWTPARSARERLPVMVWIYGGGLVGGTTSSAAIGGTNLARKGVVVVSVAYRLGALGFLADPELSSESSHHVSGNYGLLDVIAALKWIQANIRRFGGDPSRVTVFGQSAGGSIASMLAAYPLGKGLFRRAISESGTIEGGGASTLSDLKAAEATGKRFLSKLGARDIAAARALPAAAIVKTQDSFGRFLPVLDNYVILGDEYDRYATDRFTDTALLLGTNADEGELLVPPSTTPARFEARIRAQFGSHADAILALYPHATDVEAEQAARDAVRDGELAWDAWTWAKLYARRHRYPVYLYYFDRRSPQAPRGPTHGAEIVYVFDNLIGVPGIGLIGTPGPADVALSKLIQGYWVNFARTGDPNGPGLPQWPAFSASSPQVMYLDAHPHAGPVPNLRQLEVFDAYYAWRRAEAHAAARHAPDSRAAP